jgi:DNA-binding NarL/FixJ family response regulator
MPARRPPSLSSATPPPARIRVLVVDDHAILRSGLVEIINECADLTVCAEASTSAAALAAVAEHRPDVVIVDVSLGLESGFDLVAPIAERCPSVRVLMLSGHDERQFAERARVAGAFGYVVKGSATASLLAAVRRVAAGDTWFDTSSD